MSKNSKEQSAASSAISFGKIEQEPLSSMPFYGSYLPPLEIHKKQIREYFNGFIFKFVEQANLLTAASERSELKRVNLELKKMQLAIGELEMVLNKIPNLFWRERGYKQLLTLLEGAFQIGSKATVSKSAVAFIRTKQQPAIMRVAQSKKTGITSDALREIILELEKHAPLVDSEKYAASIRPEIVKRLGKRAKDVPHSQRTIRRRVQEILRERRV